MNHKGTKDTKKSLVEAIQRVLGGSSYEHYRERIRKTGGEPLTQEQFYLESLKRRYTGVSRCC